jgi:hypothetical protein
MNTPPEERAVSGSPQDGDNVQSCVPTVVRKNRPDVTNPDKAFGVRQQAAALQMQRRNCDGSTRFATDQRRFFLTTAGTQALERQSLFEYAGIRLEKLSVAETFYSHFLPAIEISEWLFQAAKNGR